MLSANWDPILLDHVYRLNKSLYDLKQALWARYNCFASFQISLGFTEAKSNTSLFIFSRGTRIVYLRLYVYDIVLTASSLPLLHHVIVALKKEFAMKDLEPLHHFLGIAV